MKGAAYAADLARVFQSFYQDPHWILPVQVEYPVPGSLLEVWRLGPNQTLIHPSRNRFRTVPDAETRALLHALATTGSTMSDDRKYAERLKTLPKAPVLPKAPIRKGP
jgi:hypothetical protein